MTFNNNKRSKDGVHFIIYWDLQQGLENILLQLAQVTETLKPVNLITVLP